MNKSFFTIRPGVSAGDIVALLQAHSLESACVSGAEIVIQDIVSAEAATAGALCYVGTKETAQQLAETTDSIVVTTAALSGSVGSNNAVITVANPRIAFAKICADLCTAMAFTLPGAVDPTAQIAASAIIGKGVTVGPHSVIEAGVVINDGVSIGAHCVIKANSVVSFAALGDHVTLMPATVLGEAGFGFDMTPSGPVMMPHLGIVRIGDGSTIGSHSAVHRGGLGDTVIGASVMLDSFTHIAHNCVLEDRVVAAAQLGMAGSSRIGKDVVIGGQVGIGDHLTIGEGAVLMARSGVTKDVPAGMTVVGFPAQDAGAYWREQAALRGLLRRKKNVE